MTNKNITRALLLTPNENKTFSFGTLHLEDFFFHKLRLYPVFSTLKSCVTTLSPSSQRMSAASFRRACQYRVPRVDERVKSPRVVRACTSPPPNVLLGARVPRWTGRHRVGWRPWRTLLDQRLSQNGSKY